LEVGAGGYQLGGVWGGGKRADAKVGGEEGAGSGEGGEDIAVGRRLGGFGQWMRQRAKWNGVGERTLEPGGRDPLRW
jgi:hypothetical protein